MSLSSHSLVPFAFPAHDDCRHYVLLCLHSNCVSNLQAQRAVEARTGRSSSEARQHHRQCLLGGHLYTSPVSLFHDADVYKSGLPLYLVGWSSQWRYHRHHSHRLTPPSLAQQQRYSNANMHVRVLPSPALYSANQNAVRQTLFTSS